MTDRIGTIPPPATSQDTNPPTITTLVGGIVGDLQKLVRQEIQLARGELQQEWDKTKVAASSMAAGGALLGVAGILLCFMFVYLLSEYVKALPLWACYGIVGGLLAVCGILLLGIGRAKVNQIQIVPPQTAETMRENVEWIQNQT